MSIKKDLKARGVFINKRKRAEMLAVSLTMAVGVCAVVIVLVLLGAITS